MFNNHFDEKGNFIFRRTWDSYFAFLDMHLAPTRKAKLPSGPLGDAARDFIDWMWQKKRYPDLTDTDYLRGYLLDPTTNCFKYIKSYEEVGELARLLNSNGYDIIEPICYPDIYNIALKHHEKQIETYTIKPREAVDNVDNLTTAATRYTP